MRPKCVCAYKYDYFMKLNILRCYIELKNDKNCRAWSSEKVEKNHLMVPPLNHFQGKNKNCSSLARTISASRRSFFANLTTFERHSGLWADEAYLESCQSSDWSCSDNKASLSSSETVLEWSNGTELGKIYINFLIKWDLPPVGNRANLYSNHPRGP